MVSSGWSGGTERGATGWGVTIVMLQMTFSRTFKLTKYSGTSVKQPPRGMANFGCLREVAA